MILSSRRGEEDDVGLTDANGQDLPVDDLGVWQAIVRRVVASALAAGGE